MRQPAQSMPQQPSQPKLFPTRILMVMMLMVISRLMPKVMVHIQPIMFMKEVQCNLYKTNLKVLRALNTQKQGIIICEEITGYKTSVKR